MNFILCLILGYLLGSIPFSLVIGKVFYHTDLRTQGSGNLGGTNAGRTLGKKAGIAVIALDIIKVVVAVGIASLLSPHASIWTGLAAALGHCYSIFIKFRGGKAVATMFGFLLGTSIFTFHNIWFVIIPFIVLVVTLYFTKMVSFSSMVAACSSTIFILMMTRDWQAICASLLFTILIIYRHKDNIQRIKDGTERKITWM